MTVQSKGVRTHTLSDGTVVLEPFSYTPLIFVILLFLSTVSWIATKIDLYVLFTRFSNFFNILKRMTSPDWSYYHRAINPLLDTIQMSFLGSLVGAFLALPVAFLSASNINKSRLLLAFTRGILSLIRTIPVFVYAIFLVLAFGLGVFAGTVSIALFTFGIMTKMIYEKIETLDLSAYIAIEATGASKFKAFMTAIIPQLLPSYLSFSLYSFEINIRFAAILGWVGAGGVGLLFNDRIAFRRYDQVAVLILMLFVVVFTIESISRYLRRRLT